MFMAPGVSHCGGGPGPGVLDDLGALDNWVANGAAPDQILAAHYSLGFANGVIDRVRPLCPYPQIARYQGSGDINVAASFYCSPTGAAPPVSIVATAGTPQSTTVTAAFIPLQARVTDAQTHPIAGVPVTFAAPPGDLGATFGGVNSITVNTNANGVVTSPVLTATSVPGTYGVVATVAGLSTPAMFTLTNTPAAGLTIFGAATPQAFIMDPTPVEIGVRFQSEVNGRITALRFYKGAGDNSIHTGSLWADDGTLLVTGTYSGESASGWQQLSLSSPIDIKANTTYVVSYHSGGSYSVTVGGFARNGADAPPLHALRDGVDGSNGVYIYGPGGLFPTQTFQATNYWADVVFVPAALHLQGSRPPLHAPRGPQLRQ
jgi:hypothetical protein